MLTVTERTIANHVLNVGLQGIARQGRFSVDGTSCRYRANNQASCSVRCLIGHAINDEHYDNAFEGTTPTNAHSKDTEKLNFAIARSVPGLDTEFVIDPQEELADLLRLMQQQLHDVLSIRDLDLQQLRRQALNFATGHKLTLLPETITALGG